MRTSPFEETKFIHVRGLNEYAYCPRLYHLMYIQGLFEESIDTLEGRIAHQKRLTKNKKGAKDEGDEEPPTPWKASRIREFTLSSEHLGIIGKFDVILNEKEESCPVEMKHGPAPEGSGHFHIGPHMVPATAWGNDQIQLAAQIALLQEAGYKCRKGYLYYQKTRTQVEIPWNETLDSALKWVITQTGSMTPAAVPKPLRDSNKCIRCSLNHVCLPDETHLLTGNIDEPRQLYPGRDDNGILHLVTPGTRIGKSGETLKITIPDEKPASIPIKDIAQVCCWGNAQFSTQAVLELAGRGIGIAWLSGGGWLRAVTIAPLEKNVYLRRNQYQIFDDPVQCLKLSTAIVTAKIENQRILLRRNKKYTAVENTLEILKTCRERASNAETIESLRGIEGYAAKSYWETFPSILIEKNGVRLPMKGRNRRPPKDPVNTLLSFGYAMLLRDFMTAIHGVGLDPLYGFLHAVVPGRPALALDLMEAFRPLVVDSIALRTINEGSFSQTDFVQMKEFCSLKPHAKKRWIKAYERRVDEMITHPVFGYRLSYRRIFTVEARLLGRYIAGELPDYRPLTTR